MDNIKKHEEFMKLIDETSRVLDEKLINGEITQYEYDELKSLDIEYDEEKDPIELFKELYTERKPIKCSKLLLAIYDKHKNSFRKAVLLSECFPDPLGFMYNQEIHGFTILIIERAFKLSISKEYPEEFISELRQLYLAFMFFNHNNLRNTEKLDKCEFMDFSLSEQIRMIGIFLQDQNRLVQQLKENEIKRQEFFTGMESAISNRIPDRNPNMLVSFEDNLEGLLEAFDIIIRYLYFKKSKDYKKKTIPEHGDITHIKIPSLELIIHLSIQRNLLIKTWEKFKYSQWNVGLQNNDGEETYIFMPKLEEEYREHIIGANRRQYFLMSNLFKNKYIESELKNREIISKISGEINKDEIKTLFSINKEDYFCAIKTYQSMINAYKLNMHPYYLELNLDGVMIEDTFRVFELLHVLAECYKQAIYKDFDQEDNSWYKYLCPIIPIEYFTESLTNYYGFTKEYSLKLINCFTFKKGIQGESDVFSRPLILVNSANIIFCPILMQQMNLERIIEMLLSNFKVNIARIGTDFENRIKLILSYVNGIKVNTSKIEFFASDGRDIEFDFIGTFDDHLLLWEFKAMTVPYSAKKHLECKKTIMEGVDQIERRSRIIKTDWKKIKELANIELPEEPFSDDKIIKLVGTNIFDFTTLVYGDDIRIVDESTLLKFFVNPEVKVMSINDKKVLNSKKLWKSSVPTTNEFKQYLENPITTSPYNECIEAFPKAFDVFEDDYPFAIIDQILTKDPYGQEIESVIKFKKETLNNKKHKRKKSSNKKTKSPKKKRKKKKK
ncbi:hypothetical protein [Oceanirhabdus sp. W0125-5]|uniref:hypothetical protein n=1 Tax=Oceanirhabdus sp. W0125-5 TaxID=2999116 RepID=UPI0022F31DFD|nr:hypothetical protein [Oceanirhabdus sp. W0125-5]WBW98836.1 hypothetical protein OW730_08870 [Oceanirhabdus sp. W0125-5]